MHNVLVLCYHAVSNGWPSSLAVRATELENQVRTLLDRGYTAATFGDALSGAASGVFVVTFDDGFQSVLDHGLPVLDRLGVPATMFVPTGLVGPAGLALWPGPDAWSDTEHREELRVLDWAGVRTLADHGWEIGSHTCSHPRLTQLGDAELAAELSDSRLECERQLGRTCASIAYPYGDYDERVVAAAGEAGYRFGCTLPDKFTPSATLAWPRIGIYRDDGSMTFRLKTSQATMWIRQSPAWNTVSRLRRLIPRTAATEPPVGTD
jgi:peptidoglycan/xylan/chitin deacetylase (PgdA/CDA1 family)